MKITRRAVLRLTGAAAASLALSSCSASGTILGSNFSAWLQKTLGGSASSAASSDAASDLVVSPLPEGEQLDPGFAVTPAYDADPLTGEARRSGGRSVGVMVNNISNTPRQNARPQRGIGSADVLIECKVEGGITRFCAVFHDADAIPEIGPLRSGRDQFLQLLMPYQALYYHDGESAACTKFISVYDYSGLNIGGKSYFPRSTPMWPTATAAAGTWPTSTPSSPPAPRSSRLPPTQASAWTTPATPPSSALRTTAPAPRTP